MSFDDQTYDQYYIDQTPCDKFKASNGLFPNYIFT